MRIPSGDLSPARTPRRLGPGRRRRRSGGYGGPGRSGGPRRRSGRRRRLLGGLALLAVIAGGTGLWLQMRAGGGGAEDAPEQLAACPAVAPPPPVMPSAVRLRLLNGTTRDGLGAAVGTELGARGFAVVETTNAERPDPGPATVVYGAGGRERAVLLAAQVLDSRLLPQPKAAPGSVTLVLGGTYSRLRTPAEATGWLAGQPAAPAPAVPAGC